MTDPVIADLRRELEKARDALAAVERPLARHAEMNAALHCAERVMYSPLHAKVTAAMNGIDHTLARTEPDPDDGEASADSRRDSALASVLIGLDRCVHGRHEGDDCGDTCGYRSQGNPHLRPGSVIGYGMRGDQIVMPSRDDKHNPAAWRRPTPTGGPDA
ncbi:hypothetical protein [Streptomyces flavidovirens]